MKMNRRTLLSLSVLSIAATLSLTACKGDNADGTATATDHGTSTATASAPGISSYLGTLGNSATIVAAGSHVSVQGVAGEEMWKFELPDGDLVAGRPAGALSSTTYVRGNKNIYAFAPDGKLAWKYPHTDQNATIRSIFALGDSTAAITVGDTSVVAFNSEGQPRWTYLLPNGDRIVAEPVVASNSFVYVRGAKMLYCIDSQGGVNWQKEMP